MKDIIYTIIALFIGLVVGYFSRGIAVVESVTRTIDTVYIEKPIPYEVEVVRKESVPVMVKIPSDTIVLTRVDSVLIEVPIEIEKREYKDSLYRAVVSGARVGNIHPMLEELELFSNSKTEITQSSKRGIGFYVSASAGRDILGLGGGISIKQKVDLGAKYVRVGETNGLVIDLAYRF